MALQNRVRPDGEIVAHPARGTMLGNRGGQLHDPATKTLTRRRWASKAWIACETAFRGRWRPVMGRGYTELFFLDEGDGVGGRAPALFRVPEGPMPGVWRIMGAGSGARRSAQGGRDGRGAACGAAGWPGQEIA